MVIKVIRELKSVSRLLSFFQKVDPELIFNHGQAMITIGIGGFKIFPENYPRTFQAILLEL